MDDAPEILSTRAKLMPMLSLISACLIAAAGTYVLGLFESIASDHELTLSPVTLFILDHRMWLFLVVLPSLLFALCGVLIKSGWARVTLAALSELTLAAVFAVIAIAAFGTIAPLYQYQAL